MENKNAMRAGQIEIRNRRRNANADDDEGREKRATAIRVRVSSPCNRYAHTAVPMPTRDDMAITTKKSAVLTVGPNYIKGKIVTQHIK